MDKNEYNVKLQEIDKLVDQGNYAAAAAAADQIDWKRVRNVRTLCLISEIYEAENRYEDSKALLLRAYKRSPVGRAILYRLVEVTIKLRQFDEAIEYYSEYVQAAPNDTNKYILKYKIYRGRGSSVDEQIQILKEYLSQEYNEKYAYELAKLYQEADRIQECLATCDDLVLWFHSGKYVIKALELKMKYASLTPKQQEIYDHRFDEEDEDEEFSGIGKEKQIVTEASVPSEAAKIIEDAQKSIASELSQDAVQTAEASEMRQAAEAGKEDPAEAALDGAGDSAAAAVTETGSAIEAAAGLEDSSIDGTETASASEAAGAVTEEPGSDGENTAGEESHMVMPPERTFDGPAQDDAQAGAEDEALDEPVADAGRFDAELQRFNTQELQTEMIKSMREIVSGVGLRDLVDEEEEEADRLIEASKRAQEKPLAGPGVTLTRKLTMPELEKKRDAGQLSIDDILLSMGDRGSAVREAAAKASKPVKPQPAGVLSAVDEALLNMGISPEAKPRKEKPLDELFKPDGPETAAAEEMPEHVQPAEEGIAEAAEGTAAKEAPAEEAWDTAAKEVPAEEVRDAAAKEAPAETAWDTAAKEAPAEEDRDAAAKEASAEEDWDAAAKEAPAETAGDAAAKEAPAETAGEAVQEEISAEEAAPETEAALSDEDDDVKIAPPPVHKSPAEMEELAAAGAMLAHMEKGGLRGDASQDMTMDEIINAKTRKMPAEEIARRRGQISPEFENPEQDGEDVKENDLSEHDAEAGASSEGEAGADQDVSLHAAGEEGKTAEKRAPMYVKPYLRGFFDGYLEVRDMDRQINEAIGQALAKGDDRTSRSGNILIFGGHGCGKTTIATGLAKAIARERGQGSVKMARIYATDLNRKDIAATIAKISGGVLIIEEAGDLEDGIADQLTTAMEFRTDGLIIILEDEQRYMHDLLMRHPRMTMKFTSQIYVPPYRTQDLVRFAQLYADDRDYAISESAAAVLGAKLDHLAQSQDAPLAITAALDLVDAAIIRANKFGRKLFSGKKRYDSEGRIVLLDKDMK